MILWQGDVYNACPLTFLLRNYSMSSYEKIEKEAKLDE